MSNVHFIATDIDGDVFGVDGKTVGEYTGLKDKNGRDIYEGDIVQYQDYITGYIGTVNIGKWKQDGSGDEYSPTLCLGVLIKRVKCLDEYEAWVPECKKTVSILSVYDIEVIGNIYHNPEMIKESD